MGLVGFGTRLGRDFINVADGFSDLGKVLPCGNGLPRIRSGERA